MKRIARMLAATIVLAGSLATFVPQTYSQHTILHGFAYGSFREGQSPEQGIFPSAEQIRQDMQMVKIDGNAIRSYGCLQLEAIAEASSAAGITLAQGIWLDNTPADQDEIDCGVAQAQKYKNITLLIAGNERVLVNHLSVAQICAAILSTATTLRF